MKPVYLKSYKNISWLEVAWYIHAFVNPNLYVYKINNKKELKKFIKATKEAEENRIEIKTAVDDPLTKEVQNKSFKISDVTY